MPFIEEKIRELLCLYEPHGLCLNIPRVPYDFSSAGNEKCHDSTLTHRPCSGGVRARPNQPATDLTACCCFQINGRLDSVLGVIWSAQEAGGWLCGVHFSSYSRGWTWKWKEHLECLWCFKTDLALQSQSNGLGDRSKVHHVGTFEKRLNWKCPLWVYYLTESLCGALVAALWCAVLGFHWNTLGKHHCIGRKMW